MTKHRKTLSNDKTTKLISPEKLDFQPDDMNDRLDYQDDLEDTIDMRDGNDPMDEMMMMGNQDEEK